MNAVPTTVLSLSLLAILSPVALHAQDLSGEYVFNGDAGAVTLLLRQQGALLQGTMRGADGSLFQLEGQVEAGQSRGRILLGESAGWYALGLMGGGLKVVVGELDGQGQPDTASGWEMDFVPVAAAGSQASGQAPAPDAPASTPGTGQPPGQSGDRAVSPQREDTPLLREWLGHLRGKQLKYMDSYSSNDPVGGSGGYSDKWEADLCSDGSFVFRSRSLVTADVGGVFGSSGGSAGSRGIWRLAEHNGQIVLQYRMDDGTQDQVLMSHRDGKTYFGQQRVFVTDANQSCR